MSYNPYSLYLLILLSYLYGMNSGRMSIIPEYDYNGVTILISGQRDSTNKGKLLSVTVPATTDSVLRIFTDNNNEIYFEPQNIVVRNGHRWIDFPPEIDRYSFMIKTRSFSGSGRRNFNYDLIFSFPVSNLLLEIQQPLGSKNFSHSESEATVESDQHGMRSYTVKLSQIPANEPREIWIKYDNSRGITSLALLAEMMSTVPQVEKEVEPKNSIIRHKLYILEPLIALAVVTIIIAAILILLKEKLMTKTCLNCSQRIAAKDKFCPNCGNKI